MSVSGYATVQVLTAALALPSFTAEELAAKAGVPKATVRNVLNRHSGFFGRVSRELSGTPGRPRERWSIRVDRLSELGGIAQEASMHNASSLPPEDAAFVDASLGMALQSLKTAFSELMDNVKSARALLAAARNDLVAAGFSRSGVPLPDLELDKGSAAKAMLIAVVCDLIDAKLIDDRPQIDRSQARAYPVLAKIKANEWASINEWVSMAHVLATIGGTLIPAPVAVPESDWDFFCDLFPRLVEVTSRDAGGFVVAVDDWITDWIMPTEPIRPVAALLHGADLLNDQEMAPAREIVVGTPEDSIGADERGAPFVLVSDDGSGRTQANIVQEVTQITLYEPAY